MRRRDEVDFTEFATAAVRRLRRTAYLMCGDWHRAEDAAQDALVRVYKAWHRLDHRAGLNSYAHKAVVSVVLDQAKRPWRREHVVDQPVEQPLADPAGTIDEDLKWQQDFEVWTDRDGAEGTVPKNVAAVDFEIDGIVSPATVKNGLLLWYAELTPTDVRDKPIWAIYYDVNGRELARFDSNVYNPWEGYDADRQPVYPK